MKKAELMEIAMKAGEVMLISGAEIYRAEETIVRVCGSYDVQCESFVLPTGIFISIRGDDGCMQTAFKRIRQRTVDLNKIDRVNDFSRSLKNSPLSYEAAAKRLSEIEQTERYCLPIRMGAAALGSFVFTRLFNGSFYDGLAAAIIGLIAYIIKQSLSKKSLFQFFELFTVGLLAGLLSVSAVKLFPVLNIYKIIIGSVMLYLPGVAITNGIKDAFYGDLVASLTRLGEALLIAAAIAAGVGISLSIGL